jgi:hypothetical protein
MSRRRKLLTIPVLLPLLGAGLLACGDSTEPVSDPLAGIDELAIYAATVDRLALLSPTGEANRNLRQAVGWPPTSVPPGLFGRTLIYESGAGWTVAADRPAVPADVVRVIWYELNGPAVALPTSEVGYIDVTDRADPASTRVDVRVVRSTSTVLADYVMRVGATDAGGTRSRSFRVDGSVGDGARQLQIALREDESETVATGDRTSSYGLALTEAAFTYNAAVEADTTVATGVATARFVASVTVDGVRTGLELAVQTGSDAALSGTGFLTHAGARIANIEVSGTARTFTRPDGGSFSNAQQIRLGTLMEIMLMPVFSLQAYFS